MSEQTGSGNIQTAVIRFGLPEPHRVMLDKKDQITTLALDRPGPGGYTWCE